MYLSVSYFCWDFFTPWPMWRAPPSAFGKAQKISRHPKRTSWERFSGPDCRCQTEKIRSGESMNLRVNMGQPWIWALRIVKKMRQWDLLFTMNEYLNGVNAPKHDGTWWMMIFVAATRCHLKQLIARTWCQRCRRPGFDRERRSVQPPTDQR